MLMRKDDINTLNLNNGTLYTLWGINILSKKLNKINNERILVSFVY